MMKTRLNKKTFFFFFPLAFFSWHTAAHAVEATETESTFKLTTGIFHSEHHITRAEAAEQFALALELPVREADSVYSDVGDGHWAKDYIAAVTKSGLFHGYLDGTFKPDQVMTRAQMAKVLVIAYKPGGSAKGHFTDTSSSWAKDYISALAKK